MLTNAPYWDTSMKGEVDIATANYKSISMFPFAQKVVAIISHIVEPV